MKKGMKIIGLISIVFLIWALYTFMNFPNKENIKNNVKSPFSETPDPINYKRLVKLDQHNSNVILLGKAMSAKMYKNKIPFSNHKFDLDQTNRILNVLKDSTNFQWGELGTPYYDEIIVFFDKNENTIGYLDLSLDGQIDVYPNIALTKWGLLTDKGFKEIISAVRIE